MDYMKKSEAKKRKSAKNSNEFFFLEQNKVNHSIFGLGQCLSQISNQLEKSWKELDFVSIALSQQLNAKTALEREQ